MKHPFITFPESLLCFKYKPLGMYNYFFIYGNVHLRYNASFWKQNPILRDCEYIRFKPSEQSLKKIYLKSVFRTLSNIYDGDFLGNSELLTAMIECFWKKKLFIGNQLIRKLVEPSKIKKLLQLPK